MQVEIDQSGKIGDTKVSTILAFSNSHQFTISIPATVKRKCILQLREWGLSASTSYLQFFTVGLYFLLRDGISTIKQVIIDVEYSGKDKLIKEHLINLLARRGYKVNPDKIGFGLIGKKSPAHILALQTFRKLKQPNLVLTQQQILEEFGHQTQPTKKAGDCLLDRKAHFNRPVKDRGR